MGSEMETRIFDLSREWEAGMEAGAAAIREGRLCVFPTETVYGIGADAMAPEAVGEIFRAKGRPQDNPLIVHIYDMEQAEQIAREISPMARRLMETYWPGPFTAVVPCRGSVPREVTAGLDTVGIRMPSHPGARELLRRSGRLIAAPSANLSGRPSPTRVSHVVDDFLGRVPVILDGGDCSVGVESTVVDLTGDVPLVLRPGGVTPEMIQAQAGRVAVSPAVLDGLQEGEQAASPGMKYKHYAPRAKVVVGDGESRKAIAIKLNSMYDRYIRQGRKTVILCSEESLPLYGERQARSIGRTEEEIASRIFSALRQADKDGLDVVLFEAVSKTGMGLAVMNRMIRAAGFDVI